MLNWPRNRRLTRELRRRVDRLHREYDRHDRLPGLLDENDRPRSGAPSDSRFTLRAEIRACLDRRRETWSGIASFGAERYAREMADLELNPVVLAQFARERVGADARQALSFDHAPPLYYLNGRPCVVDGRGRVRRASFDGRDYPAVPAEVIASARTVNVDVELAKASGVVPARWSPGRSSPVVDCDPMRPPVEAMALIAAVVPASAANVVCAATGYSFAAQALSAHLPHSLVHADPTPYETSAGSPAASFDLTVLGFPSFHQYLVAWALLGRGGDAPVTCHLGRQAILHGTGRRADEVHHLPELLHRARVHRSPGKLLALVGDPEPHHAAVVQLLRGADIEPTVGGLETERRGIWVDYVAPQPSRYGVPRPTGKVVSFWRWT